jgi:hypothetical protein
MIMNVFDTVRRALNVATSSNNQQSSNPVHHHRSGLYARTYEGTQNPTRTLEVQRGSVIGGIVFSTDTSS